MPAAGKSGKAPQIFFVLCFECLSLPRPQFAHYKEEMYTTAQRAFGISPDRHFRLLHAAGEEKPKIIVLSVIVQEAEGLEAKDANGNVGFLLIMPIY